MRFQYSIVPLRWLIGFFTLLVLLPLRAEFGIHEDERHYIVDSGGGLVFQVLKRTGGINSIKFHGEEMNISSKRSGINSGFGGDGTTTSTKMLKDVAMVIIETDETNGVVKDLTQYYFVRKGENTIFMATHAEHEPRNGELRWIARLKTELLPKVPASSEVRNHTGFIEATDVMGMKDGTTRSKYYGNDRAKDLRVRGVSGPVASVFMVYGSRESSAGGPFFKDIQTQIGETAEVYNYMNSGHNQIERLRLGVLFGPYALCFSKNTKFKAPSMGFVKDLGLKGYVGAEERGSVTLRGITGRDTAYPYTVAFSNKTAQYWSDAAVNDGASTCKHMKPGKYELTIYKGELAVHRQAVEVTKGKNTLVNSIRIVGDPSTAKAVWRIGDWDGTPLEFRNGKKLGFMHPSDKRMDSWNDGDYVIGKSTVEDFSACQWVDVNGQRKIKFHLSKDQLKSYTIRIGLTAAHAGARPRITVNQWSPRRLPGPSDQPRSRSITIGTYRGNNVTYATEVPASAFVEGENTLTFSPISGKTGQRFLSPGYALDCVDMIESE